jgi:hypothetical protein
MFDTNPYFVQSEMDYRTEKIKRGVAARRHRTRKPLVRRHKHRSETTS